MLWLAAAVLAAVPHAAAQLPPEPFVAVHVSELTQALETLPAVAPTPQGPEFSGFQWWYTSWHYFVAPGSLKEALRSDGTPYVEVSDADIAAGKLLNADGKPRYPILIALASEAVADSEVAPLRDYVAAGGFLIVGSSSFTRQPDGAPRVDFVLGKEMGVHPGSPGLFNWYQNLHFTKVVDHRLTNHIPAGKLVWRAPLSADEIPWTVLPSWKIHGAHYAWRVEAADASVLASGDSGPLLTAKSYGNGQFIFHGAMQPLLGHGGWDATTYSYLLYRRAIEWAFESFNLPLVRLSPWPFQYDAAMMVRHDFESDENDIRTIEASAQFEKTLGAKGDYFFSTGALREGMGAEPATVQSIRRAVSSYGATIGSHNGGLKNPLSPALLPTDYEYWHWGPDEVLDANPAGYADGREYASASIAASFADLEGWLSGVDNGRSGCAAADTCPRVWVSPFFNSAREESVAILDSIGAVASMGERKVAPFPHATFSYRQQETRHFPVSLPVSDWFVGDEIAQSNENHTLESIRAAVDFFYGLGALINFYGHTASNSGGVQQEYVTYGMSKPRVWGTNAVGVSDWWRLRSKAAVTPNFYSSGSSFLLKAAVSGALDAGTALDISVPNSYLADTSVFLNGKLAPPSEYRKTSGSIKVRVGSGVSLVRLQNSPNTAPAAAPDAFETDADLLVVAAPGVLSNDSDAEEAPLTAHLVQPPAHGTLTLYEDGSFTYSPSPGYLGSDSFTYAASDGSASSIPATASISVTAAFADDFERMPETPDPLLPWKAILGEWEVVQGSAEGSSAPFSYGIVQLAESPSWNDFSLQAELRFPYGGFGGGLGGRVDPASGARYAAWIYPEGFPGGSNLLQLVKFSDWTTWTLMGRAALPSSVGTGWHTLKLVFQENRIKVSYDGTTLLEAEDDGADGAPLESGTISGELWSHSYSYPMAIDNVIVRRVAAAPPPPPPTPVAQDDSFTTGSGTPLAVGAPGVLANDTSPDGSPLTAELLVAPPHGLIELQADGSFTYTPTGGYSGTDTFTYVAHNGNSSSNVATVTVTVTTAALLGEVRVEPAAVAGGSTAAGTVLLTAPAPPGGAAVTLSSTSPAASVPSTITVPEGSSSGSFTVTTTPVAASTTAVITVAYGGTAKTAPVSIEAPRLQSVVLAPDSLIGGTASQGTITLASPAPPTGTIVTLRDDSASVSVPANVTVPAGGTTALFSTTTTPVAAATTATISAVLAGETATAVLRVNPPSLKSLSLSPSTVKGGYTSKGTVTLSGRAPSGGAVISLSDNSAVVTVPSSVTVAAGSTTASFTVRTSVVGSVQTATITPTYRGGTRSAVLTVTR